MSEKFESTKFFRLMIDFMRLAQWDTVRTYLHPPLFNADLSKSVADIDRQLYHRLNFSQHMINFVEARYHYDADN